jgi:hypothetical protein
MNFGFIGPEGSGKTASMTALAIKHLSLGGCVKAFPGYEVGYTDPKTGVVVKSEPIDIEQWLSMDESLRNVLVCIDELQNFANAKKHASTLNQIFAAPGQQRRKRNLGILYTAQNFYWADTTIRFLTHVTANCMDMSLTAFGKSNHMKRGEWCSIAAYDNNGLRTGHLGEFLGLFKVHIADYWYNYDTTSIVDIGHMFTAVKAKKKKLEMDFGGNANGGVIIPDMPQTSNDKVPVGINMDEKTEMLQALAREGVTPNMLAKVAKSL